jgi:flagellar biosynthesis/type III secretory pathway protein FliH
MGKKPPSRERYEAENPVVSFRISREKKENLEELVAEHGTTKKDWLESVITDASQQYDAVWQQGHTKGYEEGKQEGYQEAKAEYLVEAPCDVCGEPMTVQSEEMKAAIFDLLTQVPRAETAGEWNWGHSSCHDAG